MSVIMTIVSLAKSRRPDSGLLTSALTTAYVIYLGSISVFSGATNSDCSSVASDTRPGRWMLVRVVADMPMIHVYLKQAVLFQQVQLGHLHDPVNHCRC